MLRYKLSVLAWASVLAFALAAAPALAAKGGNGHGDGGGNGHGVGHDVSGSTDTSTSTDADTRSLPSKAIDNKTNSGAYHSVNAPDPNALESTDSKTPNLNSAVNYSRAPSETPQDPSTTDDSADNPTDGDTTDGETTDTGDTPTDTPAP